MDSTAKILFSLQRFQILALYTNSAAEKTVSAGYAFAWLRGIYPLLNESAPWHQAHAASFPVGPQSMQELHDYLSGLHDQRTSVTYFQLEDRYGIKGAKRPGTIWSQQSLIDACRYLYLYQRFDPDFWTRLVSGSQCPMEAEVIRQKFDSADVYFE